MKPISKIIEDYKFTKDDRTFLILLAIVSTLYAIAILRPDRPYIDDLGRSLYGYAEWASVGRPLSSFVMLVLNMGYPLTDLSPFPQLLAIIVMGATCYVLYRELAAKWMPPLLTSAVSLLILLNPFLIQNLSYKFDSLPMALSIFFATLAGTRRIAGKFNVIARVCLLMIALLLYQPAAQLFLVLVFLFYFRNASTHYMKDNTSERLFINIISYILSIGTYASILPFIINRNDGYAMYRSQTLPLSQNIFGSILQNYRLFASLLSSSFSHKFYASIAAIFVLALFGCMILSVRIWRSVERSSRDWHLLSDVVILCLSPMLALFAALGYFVVFKDPPMFPRVLIGIGGVFSLIRYASTYVFLFPARRMNSKIWRIISCAGAYAPTLLLILFTIDQLFAFSVAQSAQRSFDREIVFRIDEALRTSSISLPQPLVISGTIPMPRRAKVIAQRYPIIPKLVPRYLDNEWDWGYTMLEYYGLDFKPVSSRERDKVLAEEGSGTKLYEDRYFDLYRVEDVLVLRFK